MQKAGYLSIFGGWVAALYALKESQIFIDNQWVAILFFLVDFPWTNFVILLFVPISLLLLFQNEEHSLKYRYYRILSTSLLLFIGCFANFLLIALFVDFFIYDFVAKIPPFQVEVLITIALSILWWPLAWAFFRGRVKSKKFHILRSIWTIVGSLLLMECFRGLEYHIGSKYWLTHYKGSVFSILGFSLVFIGGVVLEWRTQQSTD